jgi:nucleotide-binding universal stress UspA family protein
VQHPNKPVEAIVKILYATDGGLPARQALALLERVAARDRLQVEAVTVHPGSVAMTDDENLAPAELVAAVVARLQRAGIEADRRLLKGHPAAAILEEIIDGGFELAVLGAGNRSRLGRLLMGSVSTKVLHTSPTSLMVVHRAPEHEGLVRVLFGTDGSKPADRALDQMIGFLDPSSCEIDVVAVAEKLMPVITFTVPREAHATGAPTPELEQEWLAAADRYASEAAMRLQGAHFKCTFKARLGAPSLRLLDEVDAAQADLVGVGSSGLGALERAVVGSVSDQMVRHAPATFVARSVIRNRVQAP